MKNNIILMYFIYLLLVYLLCIIDVTILIYYIFWINNMLILPLFWLWVKIIYYNRAILLLLFFYYLLAKFTIKELGYKYIYFFKLDIRKWRSFYLNYIWDITAYHIEIISILLFLIVIILPLFLHNKQIGILVVFSISLIILFFKIVQHRWKYIKNKRAKLIELLIIWFLIFFSIKIFNHHYFKDIIMTYMHLDKFAFNMLEWKIQMYDKMMAKDYLYHQTIGIKPKWVGTKINIQDMEEKKKWDVLTQQKQISFWIEFKKYWKANWNSTKYKYFLYIKFYKKVGKVRCSQVIEDYEKIKENLFLKKKKKPNLYINIKEYTPKVNTDKENPVVTEEKERERALHQKIVFNKMLKFSNKNYHDLNYLLKNLTLKTLYNQPFFDKKVYKKEAINEKRLSLILSLKEKINKKEDVTLYNKIIEKISKNNKLFQLNKTKIINKEVKNLDNLKKTEKVTSYKFLTKIFNYFNVNNNDLIFFKNLFNVKKIEEINTNKIKKNQKSDIPLLLKKVNKNIVLNKEKENIIKKEKFLKKHKYTYYVKKETRRIIIKHY